MKNIGYVFLFLLVFISCKEKDSEKKLVAVVKEIPNATNMQSEAYTLLKTQCYACHSVSTASHDAIIAPPMVAVKRRYKMAYDSKDDFVNAVSNWTLNPEKDKALMRGAVNKFNLMPKQSFKEEDIRKIAAYIYDIDLEEPAWFKEHEKEMHGGKKGMGMGK